MIQKNPVVVVAPKVPAEGRPWVWHGEFFGHKPDPDIALLGKGFHIVYLSVPNLLGSPVAVKHWNACYATMTETYDLAQRWRSSVSVEVGCTATTGPLRIRSMSPASMQTLRSATSRAGRVEKGRGRAIPKIGLVLKTLGIQER